VRENNQGPIHQEPAQGNVVVHPQEKYAKFSRHMSIG